MEESIFSYPQQQCMSEKQPKLHEIKKLQFNALNRWEGKGEGEGGRLEFLSPNSPLFLFFLCNCGGAVHHARQD